MEPTPDCHNLDALVEGVVTVTIIVILVVIVVVIGLPPVGRRVYRILWSVGDL